MHVRDTISRQPVPRLHRDNWPSVTELARLRDTAGITEIEVTDPVQLNERDPVTLTSWLASLRDAVSALVTVRWTGQVTLPPTLVTNLVHLPPPTDTENQPWHDLHPGSALYFRRGPGFIQIKDTRRNRHRMIITLDHPAELELFERIARPVDIGELAGLHRHLHEFLDAGLAYQAGDLVVGLTTHLRRWPIPHTGI
jgi:hypothetical protein